MENSRIIVIESTLTVNHKTIQTTVRKKKIIKIDHLILLKKEKQLPKQIKKLFSVIIPKQLKIFKSIKKNQNYKSSTTKNQRQLYHVQSTNETIPEPPGIDNMETSRKQLSQLNCESKIVINMLELEHGYKTPIDTSFYQNDNPNSKIHESKQIMKTTYKHPSYIENHSNVKTFTKIHKPKYPHL